MTYKQELTISSFLVLAVLAGLFSFANMASANPTVFPNQAKTATATTSVNYMTVGTATTTVTYDTRGIGGSNQSNIGNTYAADSAILLVQFTASSTNSVLNITYEYSVDGIDWYQDNVSDVAGTTTVSQLVAPKNTLAWAYASSTVGGLGVSAGTATSTKAFSVPTPVRFVRAILSLSGLASTASLNGAVWATIVPKRERAE